MALVRILVDGYSLLHSWPELAAGRARHSEAARDALIKVLTSYMDACGTPITVFFDGSSGVRGKTRHGGRSGVEVLYSRAGQTADDLIERATHRFAAYGEIMAVSDDNAERETVLSLCGTTCGCLNFIQEVEDALGGLEEDIKQHNRKEQRKFSRRNPS